jgi:hypothetical protein
MFVSCVCYVLCDGPITHSEESYRTYCVCMIVCDLETSIVRLNRPEWDCCGTVEQEEETAVLFNNQSNQ